MIRQKLVIAATIVTVATLSLAGCGRENSESETEVAPTAVLDDSQAQGDVSIWAQGVEGDVLKTFVKEFEAENPDVHIEVTSVPWDSAQQKYQTAIAGGNAPDIGMLGTDWMTTFSSSLEQVPDGVDLDGIFPSSVATAEVDGKQLGVPMYADTRVVFYRTDVAGAPTSDFPADWDGFKALAKSYQDAGADYGITLGASGWNSFFGNMPFIWSNGGDVISDDQTTWTLDSNEVTETMSYLDGFFADGIADRDPSTQDGAAVAAFVDGSIPMLIGGPYTVNDILTAAGDDFADSFAVATIPASDGNTSTSLAGGGNLAVFSGTDNSDGAWKLVRWLTDPEIQVKWYEETKDLPAQQSAWDDAVLADDPKMSVFGEQLLSTMAPPTVLSWPQVSAAADTLMERMFRGVTSVDDGLADLQAQAESLGLGE